MPPTIQEAISVFKTNVQFENHNTQRLYFRALDTFGEYMAELELDNSPTDSLQKNIVVLFTGWMKEVRLYALPTRKLYQSVLRAALRFWRANYDGWIMLHPRGGAGSQPNLIDRQPGRAALPP